MKKFIIATALNFMWCGSCYDTFSEELKIWRFSDTLSLLSFDFQFDIH